MWSQHAQITFLAVQTQVCPILQKIGHENVKVEILLDQIWTLDAAEEAHFQLKGMVYYPKGPHDRRRNMMDPFKRRHPEQPPSRAPHARRDRPQPRRPQHASLPSLQ